MDRHLGLDFKFPGGFGLNRGDVVVAGDRGDERPIGIFDSGVGGLTVMDSIKKLLPQEHLIYFGDTARFPYGPRPIDEIQEFALEIMNFMSGQEVKMMVVACNSMTAATQGLEVESDSPLLGVIKPAVRAAVRATHSGKVGVLGTQATISSGQYEAALKAARPDVEVHQVVCEGFVNHVEAGDTFSKELFVLAEGYLEPLLSADVDTLILGCTHYPLLLGVLHSVTQGEVELISSADEVAKDLHKTLVELNLIRRVQDLGTRRFVVSGNAEKFKTVGSLFLTGLNWVEMVSLPLTQERPVA